jgi:hypothetical protein
MKSQVKHKAKKFEISEAGKLVLRALISDMAKECPTTGCWLWDVLTRRGYGVVNHPRFGRATMQAHTVAYAVFKGVIPPNRPVLHTCKVNGCVNPDHLFLGNVR